ncbi:hypothetical protein [Thiomicrorhabdus indica]|uniref:hypothetical protein n=1 Tax=Thiomicrorhabdus indica TaxID=2267253 RepID=UPI002AA8C9EF|nr:hypothetical protein [Thiomicrorhabdus indica]
MGVSVDSKPVNGLVGVISKFPWMMLVIVYLIVVEQLGIEMTGTPGFIFVGGVVVILFIETFKAMDLSPLGFFWDQLWAIICVALASGLIAYLYFVEGRDPTFYHWIGLAVIIADAVINPLNAFRSALRNFDVGM